jgi:hypothetical protein
MKKIINFFLAVLVCLVLNQYTVSASSHREAPLIAFDPLADNTDVYAFRSPVDTNNVVLIANYIPFQLPNGGPNYYNFGENIRYEIHVKNNASTTGDDLTYRFTFKLTNEDPTTFFKIRLGKENLKATYTLEKGIAGVFTTVITNGIVPPYNIGPRSIENSTVGLGKSYEALADNAIMTATTGEKVFCGPRDDPFFVDLGGAFDIGSFRRPGKDGLAQFNVHSIVVEVPISSLQKDGKNTKQATSILDPDFVIGVWASASRPSISTFDTNGGPAITSGNFVQVSRLGMPLTNEVINPIGQKDKWNAVYANAPEERQFIPYFTNPELALYMDDSQFGGAVPGLKPLRIQTKSLGVFDFRNYKKGLWPLKGSDAVKGTALDDAIFGTILLPDSMSPRAVDILPIFYTGVPNLRPYQLAIGKGGDPLAEGKPFINNFLPTLGDMLRLNMAVPITPRTLGKFSSLGLISAAALALTDSNYNRSTALQFIPNMDGVPNGRRLEDDVTSIELQAVSGIVLAALGLPYDDYNGDVASPQALGTYRFNAGVTKNDTTFRTNFPYVQTPWRGFIGPEYSGNLVTLPVDFVAFVAEKAENTVKLRWHVANQTSDDHFEVEFSEDGKNFRQIGGSIRAAYSKTNSYEYTHSSPLPDGMNYYRIKQVYKDGRYTYSDVRVVKFTLSNAITVYPNPATNFIRVFSKEAGLITNLFDGNGRKIASKLIVNGFGEFNVSRLPVGAYTIVAEKNGVRMETKKIIKQ